MEPRAWLDVGVRLIGVWLVVQGISHSLLATGESSVAHLLVGVFNGAAGYYLIIGAPLLFALIDAHSGEGAEVEKAVTAPREPAPALAGPAPGVMAGDVADDAPGGAAASDSDVTASAEADGEAGSNETKPDGYDSIWPARE